MLTKALAANAIFSLCSGLIMLLGTTWLERHIPLPEWTWMTLGAGLLLFALQLAAMVIKPGLAQILARQVIAADLVWVAITSIGALAFAAQLSATGIAMILVVNVIVASLAVLQETGFRITQNAKEPRSANA